MITKIDLSMWAGATGVINYINAKSNLVLPKILCRISQIVSRINRELGCFDIPKLTFLLTINLTEILKCDRSYFYVEFYQLCVSALRN